MVKAPTYEAVGPRFESQLSRGGRRIALRVRSCQASGAWFDPVSQHVPISTIPCRGRVALTRQNTTSTCNRRAGVRDDSHTPLGHAHVSLKPVSHVNPAERRPDNDPSRRRSGQEAGGNSSGAPRSGWGDGGTCLSNTLPVTLTLPNRPLDPFMPRGLSIVVWPGCIRFGATACLSLLPGITRDGWRPLRKCANSSTQYVAPHGRN